MIYCFDLDGTLCSQQSSGYYETAKPFLSAIQEVNRLYNAGHIIKIFTARGSSSKINYRELTEYQLKDWGLLYHELILQKPSYDIFIDDRAKNSLDWHKTLPKRTGLIAGCFDLIHPGYIRVFRDAKTVCDWLVIALHNDPSVERPNKCQLAHTLEERREILKAIKYIDEVTTYDTEEELYCLLETGGIDVRILSNEYKGTPYTGYDLGILVYFHERNHDYSTTNLRNKIR